MNRRTLEIEVASEPTWIETMARELADRLQLGERRQESAMLFFEDSVLKGERRFSASGGEVSIAYCKWLPSYNTEAENTQSQRTIKGLTEIFGVDYKRAVALAADYFRDGPFSEYLSLSKYYDTERNEKKAEAGVTNYIIPDRSDLKMFIKAGADSKVLAYFIVHLRDSGLPMAQLLVSDLEKREVRVLPPDIAKEEFMAYQKSSPERFRTVDSVKELSDFLAYVSRF